MHGELGLRLRELATIVDRTVAHSGGSGRSGRWLLLSLRVLHGGMLLLKLVLSHMLTVHLQLRIGHGGIGVAVYMRVKHRLRSMRLCSLTMLIHYRMSKHVTVLRNVSRRELSRRLNGRSLDSSDRHRERDVDRDIRIEWLLRVMMRLRRGHDERIILRLGRWMGILARRRMLDMLVL